MTSPSARPVRTALPSRRRQRSTRLLVAGVLLSLAAVAVVAAALTGSWLVVTIAGAGSVAAGVGATRMTYAEVLDSRRAAARERADQAKAYRALTETRTAEQAIYVADSAGRLARQEAVISRLETRLVDAAAEVIDARAELDASRLLRIEQGMALEDAGRERDRLTRRLEDAEERAAMAIVRVAELETELHVVLAEWRSGSLAPQRKHA